MDKSEVEAIVDLVMNDMLKAFAVSHWRVKVHYEPCSNPNWEGSCERQIDYIQAHITIDPARMRDTKHVIQTLRHELLHIVLAPFDLFRDLAGEEEHIDRIWTHCLESAIVNLEKVLHNMTERQLHLLQKLEYPREEEP